MIERRFSSRPRESKETSNSVYLKEGNFLQGFYGLCLVSPPLQCI